MKPGRDAYFKKRKSLGSSRRQRKKQSLARNQGQVCQSCWAALPLEELTIDHIRPVSRGGGHELENLRLLCFPCNQAKDNQWT